MNNIDRGNKSSLWPIAAISATFIGTVIGAGFASGQEIYQFFSVHGFPYGFGGLLLAIIILGFGGTKVFTIGCALKPESYREFLVYILGRPLTLLVDILLFSFLLILIGVMLAGSGAIFESINLGYWPGIIITGFLLIIVLFFDLTGLISTNLIIIPMMFAGSIGISLFAIYTPCAETVVTPLQPDWILASLQFSSYNLVLAIPILLSLAKKYPCLSLLKSGSWLGGIGLGVMAGFIYWSLICHLPHLQKNILPMIELAKLVGKIPYWGYSAILWGEMFTTLLANTYSITQRLVSLTRWSFRIWLIIVTITGIAIAQLGFINLIAECYPIFGYICFIILLFLFSKKMPRLLKSSQSSPNHL